MGRCGVADASLLRVRGSWRCEALVMHVAGTLSSVQGRLSWEDVREALRASLVHAWAGTAMADHAPPG